MQGTKTKFISLMDMVFDHVLMGRMNIFGFEMTVGYHGKSENTIKFDSSLLKS